MEGTTKWCLLVHTTTRVHAWLHLRQPDGAIDCWDRFQHFAHTSSVHGTFWRYGERTSDPPRPHATALSPRHRVQTDTGFSTGKAIMTLTQYEHTNKNQRLTHTFREHHNTMGTPPQTTLRQHCVRQTQNFATALSFSTRESLKQPRSAPPSIVRHSHLGSSESPSPLVVNFQPR